MWAASQACVCAGCMTSLQAVCCLWNSLNEPAAFWPASLLPVLYRPEYTHAHARTQSQSHTSTHIEMITTRWPVGLTSSRQSWVSDCNNATVPINTSCTAWIASNHVVRSFQYRLKLDWTGHVLRPHRPSEWSCAPPRGCRRSANSHALAVRHFNQFTRSHHGLLYFSR